MVFLSLLAIILPFSYLHPLIYHIEANFIWFYLGYILALNNSYLSVIRRKHSVLFFILILLACFSSAAIVTGNRIMVFVQALWLISFYLFIPSKNPAPLYYISKNSFGLYLFHSPLVYISFSFFPDISPILILIINFFVFGMISYLLTIAIGKLKLSFVIGEKSPISRSASQ